MGSAAKKTCLLFEYGKDKTLQNGRIVDEAYVFGEFLLRFSIDGIFSGCAAAKGKKKKQHLNDVINDQINWNFAYDPTAVPPILDLGAIDPGKSLWIILSICLWKLAEVFAKLPGIKRNTGIKSTALGRSKS